MSDFLEVVQTKPLFDDKAGRDVQQATTQMIERVTLKLRKTTAMNKLINFKV